MATGLFKSGVDLDTLLMARVNAKRADVGIQVAGVDISNRFEAIGGGTPIAATGYRSGGTDIANMFRNISESLSTHTLTAGFIDHGSGLGLSQTGFYPDYSIGAVSPSTYGGVQIGRMYDQNWISQPDYSGFYFRLPGNLPQTFFSSIVINGNTYTSASAIYIPDVETMWQWLTQAGLVNGNVYPVNINP